MFARAAFLFSLALLLVGQALSVPLPPQSSGNVVERSPGPLNTIVAYERAIPAEVAVKAVNGRLEPFSKREEALLAKRDVPVQTAAKGLNGKVVPFNKRSGEAVVGRRMIRQYGRRW